MLKQLNNWRNVYFLNEWSKFYYFTMKQTFKQLTKTDA